MPIRLLLALALASVLSAEAPRGYYRHPALHGDTVVFTAEGDLWKVSVDGGVAQRLTTHPEQETLAAISPDGLTVAFNASYEGSDEVYTMPLSGGLPERRTWEGGAAAVRGWTPQGELLYSTGTFSGLPNKELAALDLATGKTRRLPLAQADQGAFGPDGTLYFTRLPKQSSHTKRYEGGTAQNLWKLTPGAAEAVPLAADHDGTSRDPMWRDGRLYFASDRDGTLNLWSMAPDGGKLKQLTKHSGWDVLSPSLSGDRIVYQLGADLHVFDIRSGKERQLDIRLASDLDQLREKWVDEPFDYLSDAHVAPDGRRVVLTVRGRVFVAPIGPGRLVEAVRKQGVRYRDAWFLPDGKSLVALSDESGEVELWKLAADGLGEPEQLTRDGEILRWGGRVSPDGKWIAHDDKNRRMYLLEVDTGRQKLIRTNPNGFNSGSTYSPYRWSPDSRWLAVVEPAANTFEQIRLYEVESGQWVELTSDRYNSSWPAWSPDGKWIYFVSDRNLDSLVGSPWGTRQQEPFFDKPDKIYHIALKKGLRSPFRPDDEIQLASKEKEERKGEKRDDDEKTEGDEDKDDQAVRVEIDLDGLAARIEATPVPPGAYSRLSLTDKTLYYVARQSPTESKIDLKSLKVGNEPGTEPETVADDIRGYELSADGKRLMLLEAKKVSVFDVDKAIPKDAKERAKGEAKLGGWKFPVNPREELEQMFVDAWRLERDYFYDPGMHGVNWRAMRDKYESLLSRVTDRAELSDLVAQMVAELSALHIFVRGGDFREGPDQVAPARLGARLEKESCGYRVDHIYRHDPDLPEDASPLARPGVDVRDGDLITAVDGVAVGEVPDIGELLREKDGKQVRLSVTPAEGEPRDVIVEPISPSREADLRYAEWEYTRRLEVDRLSGGKIGYVHLRAMGGGNMAEWARQFYPVYNREGLIIDVRHNNGGNIDSWLLGRLLRKAWFYWKPRGGEPFWNMQYAFSGHMATLINERTASDGEAFAEGFRRLGMGELIGTRTWGGEIWLTGSNRLVDSGVATAAEIGVYDEKGDWIIEGRGVEPDVTVDNLPRATFGGKDAQLEAAVKRLLEKIEKDPPPRPGTPAYPDKSFEY